MKKITCILILCLYFFSMTVTNVSGWSESSFGTSITVNNPDDNPPTIDDVSPVNESYEQDTSLTIYVNVSDPEGSFNWWVNCSDGSSDSGSDNATSNVTMTGLDNYKKYWINVTCEDGNNRTVGKYWFYTVNASAATYYESSFGTSIDVSAATVYNTTFLNEGFGSSIIVEGMQLGDWNEWWVITKGSIPEFTAITPANNSVKRPLAFTWNCTINNPDGNTFDWSIECSNGQTNSSTADTNGSKNLTISGLSVATEYTVWVNATSTLDSSLVNNSWFNFTTTEGLGVSSVFPLNNSVNILRNTAVINATIYQDDGQEFNWSIETTPNIGTNSSTTDTNGTKNNTISGNLSYQTSYTWYLNLSCAEQYNNYTYYFTTEDLNPVSSFIATNYNSTGINISWSKNSNVTTTYIRYKKDSVPDTITDGTFLINTTNTTYNHTGLDWGTHYYYKAWGYNETDNLFSNNNATSDAYTNPQHPSDFQSTNRLMNSIEFSVTKGTNATNTVLFMNDTGSGYPDRTNGIEKANTTSATFTASGLEANTTYNWSVYSFNPDSGLWSELNATLQESTVATSGAPSGVTAERQNDTIIIVNWTKGSDYTIIRRDSSGYPATPTDGIEVYNGTGITYTDDELTPATRYYYRLWGWNGEESSVLYSSVMNITNPSPPDDLVGEITGSTLVITWTKGTGASRTVLRNDSSTQPYAPTDGSHIYNDTGTTTTVTGVDNINYFSGFSYVLMDGLHLYSRATIMTWGGLEINVYKETDPSIEIGNYTVFITNNDASETYQNTSANNPFRIGVGSVPNGADISIQVSKQGYKTRTQVVDLYENVYQTLSFYLAPDEEGSPAGESGEDWYVEPDDTTNETFASHYIITVNDETGEPIEDVYTILQRYINTTEEYETVLSDYTDSSGQIEVDLIPDTIYYVSLSHDSGDYQNATSFWTPSEVVYVEDAYKTFVLESAETEYTNETSFEEDIIFNGWINGNNLIVNYSCASLNTINTTIIVYEINTTSNLTVQFFNDTNTTNSFQLTIPINNSYCYHVVLWLNHTIFGSVSVSFNVCVDTEPLTSDTDFDARWDDILKSNPFGWANVFGLFILMGMLFSFGRRNAGISLIISGFITAGLNVVIGLSLVGLVIPATLVILGFITQWGVQRRENH